MQCLDRFNKRMSSCGSSLREEYISSTRKLLEETFADDPSFQYNIYFWRLGLKEYRYENPIDIRLYNRTFSAANGVRVEFQTLYNTPVVVGDVIYNSKADEYLICTESFDIDGVNYQGKFTLCNWILKWQTKDGRILEYPCYDMNSTQYNSGEQYNRNFTIGSSQHMITLPSDENTVEISTPQRFYLDKAKVNTTSFIVTQNDTTSHNFGKKGLVKLTVYEYPNNSANDRPDLGICDYIDMDANKSESGNAISVAQYSLHSYKSIIECNTRIIKSGGDAQIFVGKFYDEKGNEVDNILPHWTIICDFADKLQVKEFDNCLSIGIDDDLYVDEEFKLICSDSNIENATVPSTLIIKIGSLL